MCNVCSVFSTIRFSNTVADGGRRLTADEVFAFQRRGGSQMVTSVTPSLFHLLNWKLLPHRFRRLVFVVPSLCAAVDTPMSSNQSLMLLLMRLPAMLTLVREESIAQMADHQFQVCLLGLCSVGG